MSDKPIAQKMLIRSGRKIYLSNEPGGYEERLREGGTSFIRVQDAGEADFAQLFVANRRELEARLPALKASLRPEAMLWVTYRKGTSKIKSDVNRDTLHAYARTLGLEGVALVSIDEDWSAMRFKQLPPPTSLP